MDREMQDIIEAIDEHIAPEKCPCFLESEWVDLTILWKELKAKIKDTHDGIL